MKLKYYALIFVGLICLSAVTDAKAQVSVNTSSPANGAALEVRSTDKGFLIPRVTLTGTDDNTTITPAATTGLIVFNTTPAGSGATRVEQGFYFWNGGDNRWRRLMSEGYSLSYRQTNEVQALIDPDPNDETYLPYIVDIPGLDTGNIVVPFSGTYQIIAKGYLVAGDLLGAVGDGACQGAIMLVQDTGNSGTFTTLKESYITSSSKDSGGTFFENLGQCATIVFNVDLIAGTTYRFKMQGREWLPNQVGAGWFGKNTSGYTGSNGVNDAQYGSMIITLVAQN